MPLFLTPSRAGVRQIALLVLAWLMIVCIAGLTSDRAGAQSGLTDRAPVPRFGDPRGKPEKPSRIVRRIRFLTGHEFPPFNFIDSTGRLTGFNVELARAICKTLGAVCTIRAERFADLEAALEADRGDAIIAGLTATPERRKALAFTIAYMRLPGRFAVLRAAPVKPSPEGLDGRRVSVIANTAHEAYLKTFFPAAELVAFGSAEAARKALRDKQVDAHFGDAMGLSFWLIGKASQDCCVFAGGPHLEQFYFGDGLTIATARGNANLLANLNYALATIVESQAFSDLYERFFPIGFY